MHFRMPPMHLHPWRLPPSASASAPAFMCQHLPLCAQPSRIRLQTPASAAALARLPPYKRSPCASVFTHLPSQHSTLTHPPAHTRFRISPRVSVPTHAQPSPTCPHVSALTARSLHTSTPHHSLMSTAVPMGSPSRESTRNSSTFLATTTPAPAPVSCRRCKRSCGIVAVCLYWSSTSADAHNLRMPERVCGPKRVCVPKRKKCVVPLQSPRACIQCHAVRSLQLVCM